MRIKLPRAAIAAALSIAAMLPVHAAIDTNIKSYVCEKLDDFTAVMGVVKADQRELAKIGKDFGLVYKFSDVQMKYKEPNKIRIEGTVEGMKGLFVIDGTTQYVEIPRIHLKQVRHLGNSPGKKKSLMDVGLLSDYYLTYVNAKFLREGSVEGTECAVFELSYKARDEDTSHQVVYIDPKTKVVRRREAYSQVGKLQAVYYYKDVKQIAPGIYFPTTIEAHTTDRTVAGITAYKDIHVNVGVPDTIFKL